MSTNENSPRPQYTRATEAASTATGVRTHPLFDRVSAAVQSRLVVLEGWSLRYAFFRQVFPRGEHAPGDTLPGVHQHVGQDQTPREVTYADVDRLGQAIQRAFHTLTEGSAHETQTPDQLRMRQQFLRPLAEQACQAYLTCRRQEEDAALERLAQKVRDEVAATESIRRLLGRVDPLL